MTADDDPRAAIDLIDRGADDFLRKPVTPGRLARTLQAVSGRVRLLVPA
jgi:DNA-binding response OmpR family regulator